MTTELTALVPPPEFMHLRWHWLRGHRHIEPAAWQQQNSFWSLAGVPGRSTPEQMAAWTYVGPCDPDAAARIATLTSALLASAEALAYACGNLDGFSEIEKGRGNNKEAKSLFRFSKKCEKAAGAARLAAEGGKNG